MFQDLHLVDIVSVREQLGEMPKKRSAKRTPPHFPAPGPNFAEVLQEMPSPPPLSRPKRQN